MNTGSRHIHAIALSREISSAGAEWPPVEQICHREVSLYSLPYHSPILLHLRMCYGVWYDPVKIPFPVDH